MRTSMRVVLSILWWGLASTAAMVARAQPVSVEAADDTRSPALPGQAVPLPLRVLALGEALDLAQGQNLELQSVQARVDAVETLRAQVRSQWLPRVIAYGVYMHLDHDTTADLTSQFGELFAYFGSLGPVLENLGLDPMPAIDVEPLVIQHQEDYRAGGSVSMQFEPRSLVQYDSARLAHRQGETLLSTARLQLGRGITELYFGLVTLREMRAVTLRNVETRRMSMEQVQVRFNLGMTTELDLLRARLSLSEAQRQVEQLDAGFEELRHQMAMLLQTEPDFDVERPPAARRFADPEQVMTLAEADHPDLLSARLAVELAHNAYREVLWSWSPIFDASFNVNAARESAFADENLRWDVTLKLVWPIFLGGVRWAQREQRAAEELAADLHLRQVRAEIMNDIERSFIRRGQLEADFNLASEQLATAETALGIARAAYDQGVATQLDLMEAETMQFAIQARVVETELALAQQEAHIVSLTGRIWHP